MQAQGETGVQEAAKTACHIKICTPCYTDTCDAHKVALAATEQAGISFEYQICQSAMPALARNLLINETGNTERKQKLSTKYTHWLFVDADIAWLPDDIVSLLARQKHIISAAYISRSAPACYQAGKWEFAVGNPGMLVRTDSTGLNSVDWVGAGFLLCTREALEKMEHPWFQHRLVEIDEPVGQGLVRRHAIETNEDCGFCVNALRSGVRVHLDCDVIVKHCIDYAVPPLRLTRPGKHFEIGKSGPGAVDPMAAQSGTSGAQK